MKLAILVTNTDESDFSNRFPKDGEKFTSFIHSVRPDWQLESFSVKDDIFPESIDAFDGLIITGSPASVHDDAPWINRLKLLIIDAYQSGQQIFGACFGHQAIAEALGGRVGDNPDGWVLGTVETQETEQVQWSNDLEPNLNLYAAHHEQVLDLPQGAEVIRSHKSCKFAGFRMGSTIYTTQYHPEMDHGFITALTDELSAELPEEVISAAHNSLEQKADNVAFAETVARFFEVPRS